MLTQTLVCRSRWSRGLRREGPFTCCDCGFESRRGHGCLFLVSILCCKVEIFVGPITHPEGSYQQCVCVCVRVIWYNNNPLHLQWVGTGGQAKKESLYRTSRLKAVYSVRLPTGYSLSTCHTVSQHMCSVIAFVLTPSKATVVPKFL